MTTFIQGGVIHYVGVSLDCLPIARAGQLHPRHTPAHDISRQSTGDSRREQSSSQHFSLAEMANGHCYDNHNVSHPEYQENNFHHFGQQTTHSRSLGHQQLPAGDLRTTGPDWQVADLSRSSETSLDGMSGVDTNELGGYYSTPPPLYSELIQRPQETYANHFSYPCKSESTYSLGWGQSLHAQEFATRSYFDRLDRHGANEYSQEDDQLLMAGLDDHTPMGLAHAQQLWA